MPNTSWTRALFEAIDDAVFVHDEQGNILDANPAACRRLGYTRAEMLKLNTRDIDAPEFAAGFADRLQSQMSTGGIRCEGTHRTKDGKRISVDINTSAIQLNGKPAVLAVMRDITQRKQTEEALGKQSHLLQLILDSMSDAIVVADDQGQIVLFNPLAERTFGPGLVQGLFLLYRADRTTRLRELPLTRCVAGESFDGLELFVRHEEAPTGLWISVAGRPLRERSGALRGGVIVCNDITEQRRHERHARAQFDVARIIAADRDFDVSVGQILQSVCSALDFDVGVLWQAQPEERLLARVGAWEQHGLEIQRFLELSEFSYLATPTDFVAQVWNESKPRAAQSTDPDWSASPRFQAASAAGLQGVLVLPIRSGSETIAALEFWASTIQAQDHALLDLLQAVADQVGQFLDRHRVEKELSDSQALYVSLVQSLPQNIFRKDRGSHVTFGNERYCKSLKRTLPELLGKTDFDLFPAETALKYVRDDQRIMESGEPLDTVEEHYLPDGKKIYVHVVKTPVYDADNQVIGVQGIFWDVTQEVLAHETVARSERRYRQLAETTMDGIVLIDARGNIVLFNPAAERMFGYGADELLGSPGARIAPVEFHDLHEHGVAHYLGSRSKDTLSRPQEVTGRRKDGAEFPIEIALSILSDPGQGSDSSADSVQMLAAIRDLTERNKMRSVLVQNEKLASIGLLSAGVAHEINNPLAFVANNLVVLERDCQGLLDLLKLHETARSKPDSGMGSEIKAAMDAMDLPYVKDNMMRILSRTRDGIDRVTRIVHSLRGMARTEAPRRLDTRIPDLITSSLEILHGKYKRLGVVVEQAHDPHPVVNCVPTQISQVVLNLLVNAYQAIESSRRSHGKLAIRTQRLPQEFLLEVRDNGIGIQPTHVSRIFDPFFTTKDVGEGTGLGLSISHHIVSAHGGRIEVDSKLGEGSCFRVFLPLQGAG